VNNRLVPLILAVALFMENMDSTVIATSLATIAHDIGSEPIALKLALTAYLVALAIFIPISAWMADRWGARNVFRVAIIIFITGSVACAASNSLATFVGSRFLQGFGGALMTPVARLVLVRVECLAIGLLRLDAVTAQQLMQLLQGHLHAFTQLLGRCSLVTSHGAFEIVDDRQQLLNE